MEMRAVYAACLAELMEKDRHVCVLDADLGKASGTLGLRAKFPEQSFDCGVAEADMASIAAGLSSYGCRASAIWQVTSWKRYLGISPSIKPT